MRRRRGSLMTSIGASILLAGPAYRGQKTTWNPASDVGSGLPWWTPIAVAVLLLMISTLYRIRHRPKPPAPPESEPDLLPNH
jgi:hypothetical protein